jgi:hypothetical protein
MSPYCAKHTRYRVLILSLSIGKRSVFVWWNLIPNLQEWNIGYWSNGDMTQMLLSCGLQNSYFSSSSGYAYSKTTNQTNQLDQPGQI